MNVFIKTLYDRLDDERKMQLLCIMDNAINEMHNTGIISGLPPELAAIVHDPDPEVRVDRKTDLAKTVGQSFITTTQPLPIKDGTVAFMIQVNYDPRFLNSICICIQGGLEGLRMSEIYKKNPKQIMNYYIAIDDNAQDISAFLEKIKILDSLYENFHLIPMTAKPEESRSDPSAAPASKKKGFFSRLFKK